MASPTAVQTQAASPSPDRKGPPSDLVLDRLNRLHPKVIDLSLGRVERLLARLGHPERALPPVVHVAGTNGKGSVIAFLRAMVEAAGQRAHVYTSPHLVRFHERIRLAGTLIEEPHLVALLEECEAANGEEPITFFEITTAAAFLAFARTPADVVLLETGLGGRLDATNVVAQPRLTAITPVSIDHVQYLGETIAEIAFEKAGILKPGVPAVIAPQPPAAMQVIEARAAAIGAPLLRAGRDWRLTRDGEGFRFAGQGLEQGYPHPVLRGDYQIVNAACALACAEALGLDGAARRRGLAEADWPARLQRIEQGPLARLLPPDWELWLDGGHNAGAGAALAQVAAAWDRRPLHLIYGMLNTKAAEDFLRPLGSFAASLQAVAIPGVVATLSAEEAAARAAAAGLGATPCASVPAALARIVEQADDKAPGRILICGSLYLAGHVLAELV